MDSAALLPLAMARRNDLSAKNLCMDANGRMQNGSVRNAGSSGARGTGSNIAITCRRSGDGIPASNTEISQVCAARTVTSRSDFERPG